MPYKLIVIATLLFFLIFIGYQYVRSIDSRLEIVVCDVGQGDGIYIKTPSGKHILFDAGPDKAIIGCLGDHMAFWQREIDLIILSHPHADHYGGIIEVLKRYKVAKFISEDVMGEGEGFRKLQRSLKAKGLSYDVVYRGDRIRLRDGVLLSILGPQRSFRNKKLVGNKINPSDVSLEMLLSYGNFNAFFSGDSNKDEMDEAILLDLPSIEMLQVPHHGSKNGLSKEVFEALSPEFLTISVGKDNDYGHPSPLILKFLTDSHAKFFRTDQNGDVRLKSNGKSYNLY